MISPELQRHKAPSQKNKPIPLPEDTGEEMIITRGLEAQEEFDPTKKGKESGAYSGATPKGLVGAAESRDLAEQDMKAYENKALADEKKYIDLMEKFMLKKGTASSKIQELNRFIGWTIRKENNYIIAHDVLAKKRYQKLRAKAEEYLGDLGAKRDKRAA